MKKKILIIIFCVVIFIVAALYGFKWYCLEHQPVKMYHPVLPDWVDEGIRQMDRFTCFTAGITWYVATDFNGVEYFINIRSEDGCIWIRLRDRKDKWHKISNKDYLYKFSFYNLKEYKFNKGIFKKGYMK